MKAFLYSILCLLFCLQAGVLRAQDDGSGTDDGTDPDPAPVGITQVRLAQTPNRSAFVFGDSVTFKLLISEEEESEKTYSWKKIKEGGDEELSTEDSLKLSRLSIGDTGRYYCVVTADHGSGAVQYHSDTLAVRVVGITRVQVGQTPAGRLAFGVGEQVVLEAVVTEAGSTSKTYSWKKIGEDGDTDQGTEVTWTRSLTLDDTGRYYCVVTAAYESGAVQYTSDTLTIRVVGVTDVQLQQTPSDRSVFALGETVVFNAVVSEVSDSEKSYVWRKVKDGGDEEKGTGEELTLSDLALSDTGRYYCVLTAGDGSGRVQFHSDTLEVRVIGITQVQLNRTPDRTTFALGETTTLTVSVTEEEEIRKTYLWKRVQEGDDEELGTEEELVFPALSMADAGSYYCVVTAGDEFGTIQYHSDTLEVRVIGISEVEAIQTPFDRSDFGVGEQVVFGLTITEEEDSPKAYSWRQLKNGVSVERGTGKELTLSSLLLADTGSYYCVVTAGDAFGSVQYYSDTLEIGVEGLGRVRLLRAPNQTDIPLYGSIDFSLQITEKGDNSKSYLWKKVGSDVGLGTESTLGLSNLLLADAGSYYCEVTDNTHPSSKVFHSDTLQVRVIGIASVKLTRTPNQEQIEVKTTVTFGLKIDEGGAPAKTYSWRKVETNAVVGTGATLALSNIAFDKTGKYCCVVTTTATGEQHYSDTLEIEVVGIASVTGAMTPQRSQYIVGEKVTFSLNIDERGTNTKTYAWKKSTSTAVLGTGSTFDLTITTASSGNYYCTVTDQTHGNKTYNTANMGVGTIMTTTAQIFGFTRLCEGDDANYTVTVSSTGTYTYDWFRAGDDTPVATNTQALQLKDVRASQTGQYYCRIKDGVNGFYIYSNYMDVLISEYPTPVIVPTTEPTIQEGDRYGYCYGTEVNLIVENGLAGDPDGVRYLWTGLNILEQVSEEEIKVQLKHTTDYKVLVTNNGCVAEGALTLEMKRPPILLPENRYVIEGETAVLQSAAPNPGYKYTWEREDYPGVFGTSEKYSFQGIGTQTVMVTLRVETMDALRCVNTDTCYVTSLPKMSYTTSINDGFVVSRSPLDIVEEDMVLCARQSLTLNLKYTGYEGYTYEWMKISTGDVVAPVDTGSVYHIPSVALGDGASYFCRAWDIEKGGYVYSDTVQIRVNYTPLAEITAPDPSVPQCGGYPLELHGRDAIGTAAATLLSYQWRGSGFTEPADQASTAIRVGTNGHYTLTVGVAECYDTAEINIPTVIYPLNISSQIILPQPTDNVYFVAAKPEDGVLTWMMNGDPNRFKNPTEATAADINLDILAGDTVVVAKMEKAGCIYYDTCRVLIRTFVPSANEYAPDDGFAISLPSLRVTSKSPSVCVGRDITLSVFDLGYVNYKYEWRKVGQGDESFGNDISFTLYRADQTNTPGQYYCVAVDPEDPQSLIYSDTLKLTVNAGPLAVIEKNHTLLCYGEEVTIYTNTPYNVSGLETGAFIADKLEWTGPGIVSGQGTNVITVLVEENARYTLRASKNNGCWSEDTITFPVVRPQVVLSPKVTFLETPGKVSFTASTELPDAEYTWQLGQQVQVPVASTAEFSFTGDSSMVMVTVRQESCVGHDTAYVFVKQDIAYHGNEGDGFVQSRPFLLIPSDIKYVNVCPEEVCTFRTANMEYHNLKYQWWKVMPDGADPLLVHDGAEYTFVAGSSAAEEARYSGQFYCTVINPEVLTDDQSHPDYYLYSDTLILTVSAGPKAGITYEDDLQLCVNEELTLTATVSPAQGGTLTYEWLGEGIVSGQGTRRVVVAPKENTVYTVRVGDGYCSDTAFVAVEVSHPRITMPDRLHFAASVFGYVVDAEIPDGLTVAWGFRPESTGYLDMSDDEEVDIMEDGYIIAAVTDGSGCTAYDSCRVYIKEKTTFWGGDDDGFSLLDVSTTVWIEHGDGNRDEMVAVCTDGEIKLRAMVSGISVYSYRWYREEDGDIAYATPVGTEQELTISYFRAEHAGHYYCVITDLRDADVSGINKTYRSNTVEVSEKVGPIASITQVEGGISWDICVGGSVDLRGAFTYGGAEGKNNEAEYSWSGDAYNTTETVRYITATPQRDGLYILTVKHTGGCTDTVHARFNIGSPVVDIPEAIKLSVPGRVEIVAEANGAGTYNWYKRAYNSTSYGVATGDTGRIDITEDELVIVRFNQNGCYGFDTTRVFVKMPTTFAGGDDDGFAASGLRLNVYVERPSQDICRGAEVEIPLHVPALGRTLRYYWRRADDPTRVLSFEQNLKFVAYEVSDGGRFYCEVVDPDSKMTVSSDTATVTILNGPLAEISKPTENELRGFFCRAAEVLISAEATESRKTDQNDIYQYEWFGENVTPRPLDYEISAVTGNNGRYIVKASLGRCFTYDTIEIEIYEPEVDVEPVIYLEEAETVNLSVDNPDGDNIRWYYYTSDWRVVENAGGLGDTYSREFMEDANIVVQRTRNSCNGFDTCRIFVKDVRGFAGGVEDGFVTGGSGFYYRPIQYTEIVCEGGTATLFLPVVGDDFYRYTWVKEGDEEREFTQSSMCKIDSVTLEDEGWYYCVISDVNNNKTLTTDRVYLTVRSVPRAAIVAETQEVCYGEQVLLHVDRSRLDPEIDYSYLWSGKGISHVTSDSVTVEIEEDDTYHLLVSNGDCSMEDSVSIAAIRNHLDVETVHNILLGEGLTLRGYVNGSDQVSLNWIVNGISYSNQNPLLLPAASLTRSVEFTVMTTGKCVVSERGNIFVRENVPYRGGYDDGYVLPNSMPQILSQCEVLLGCNVDTAVLWVEALEANKLTFEWEKFQNNRWERYRATTGKTNVTGHDSARLVFTSIGAEDEGRYRLLLRNAYGYTYSREIRLVKGGIPKMLTYLEGIQVCENGTAPFRAEVTIPNNGTRTGLTWKWYYSKDGLSYSQVNPLNFIGPEIAISPVKEAQEGYYMVEANNYCGSVYDTAFLEVWEKPTFVKTPQDIYVCEMGSVEITTEVTGGGTYYYQFWQVEVDSKGNVVRNIRRLGGQALATPSVSINPAERSAAGYYQWRVFNQCDSTYGKPFHLYVEEEIVPNFVKVDTALCANIGGTFRFTAGPENVANPTSTLQYYWMKDGIRIKDGTRVDLNPVVTADAGTYTCYAYHSCRERQIKQYTVTTKHRPVIQRAEPYATSELCEGEAISYEVQFTTDGYKEVDISWRHNNVRLTDGKHISGSSEFRLTLDSVLLANRGYYSVVLGNECGTTSSQQDTLAVVLPARFSRDLSAQSANLCAGNNLTLSVTVPSANTETPLVYTWVKEPDPNVIGTSSSLTIRNAQYANNGTYCVYAQNRCNDVTGYDPVKSCATVEVITPKMFNLLGAGGFCRGLLREITLSGFEARTIYTLKRRMRLDETTYQTLKTVRGDTVSTAVLTFGEWGAGYYSVEAQTTIGGKTCTAVMNGGSEIYLYQLPTPEQFVFRVLKPICTGQRDGSLILDGTENNPDIAYMLQIKSPQTGLWNPVGSTFLGNGESQVWSKQTAGTYRIWAVNKESGCQVQIGDEVELRVRPYPQIFDLYAIGGDTTACFGTNSDVVLQLDGTERATSYELYQDGKATGRLATGTLINWNNVKGGTYTVQATSEYGCTIEMEGVVKVTDLPQLSRFTLGGEDVYCQEEAGTPHRLDLLGSTENIRYDFYKASQPGTVVQSLVGTGEYIFVEVPLSGTETYYVIATDPVDKCTQEMANRVTVTANRLSVIPEGDKLITINTATDLNITIRNNMGSPRTDWQPENKIDLVQTTTTRAVTKVLDAGEVFRITVSDDYCSVDTSIRVRVIGEKPYAEIRSANCITSTDTLWICEDQNVELCAHYRGGDSFSINWTDDAGYEGGIPNQTGDKLNYRRRNNADGYVVLHVTAITNGPTGAVSQFARDTVQIRVRKRPSIALTTTSPWCAVPGTATSLVLNPTETGVDYRVDYRSGTTSEFMETTVLVGNNGMVSYDIPSFQEAEHAGYYKVVAIKDHGQVTCTRESSVIQLRRTPQQFDISSGAFTEYCYGDRLDTIYVDNTEAGVTYRLMRNNSTQVGEKAGTGLRLQFNGDYGSGEYKVVATLGSCTNTMNNVITINEKERPNLSLSGMGSYCMDEFNALRLTVNNPRNGVDYSLHQEGYRDVNGKDVVLQKSGNAGGTVLQLSEIGNIPDTTGAYYVVAVHVVNQCYDTVRGLNILESPRNLTLNKNAFFYCDNLPGVPSSELVVTGADPSLTYSLVVHGTTTLAGSFRHGAGGTLEYEGVLAISGGANTTTYDIWADDQGSCSRAVATFSVRRIVESNLSLTGMRNYCMVEVPSIKVTVNYPQAGVTYSFHKPSYGAGKDQLISKAGGSPVEFTFAEVPFISDTAGAYYVMAVHTESQCRDTLWGLNILESPKNITVPKREFSYCDNLSGIDGNELVVTGADPLITYELREFGTNTKVGTFKHEADGSLVYDGVLALSGAANSVTYAIYADAGSCSRIVSDPVNGAFVVNRIVESNLNLTGMQNYCMIDAPTVKITVNSPRYGVVYALHKTGYTSDAGNDVVLQKNGGGLVSLALNEMDEIPDTVGSYYVTAVHTATQCSDTAYGLNIIESPKNLTLKVREFSYCDSEPGVAGSQLVVTGANPLVTYQLRLAGSNTLVGTFKHGIGDSLIYENLLAVPNVTPMVNDVSYTIYADAGSCARDVTEGEAFRLHRIVTPGDFTLWGDTAGCETLPLPMGVMGSPNNGLVFTLYKEGQEDPLSVKQGTGNLFFGSYSEMGTYYVTVFNQQCGRELSHRYTIGTLPEQHRIYALGTPEYCEGDWGIQLGMTETQVDMIYTLQKENTATGEYEDVPGIQIVGTGTGAAAFGGFYQQGNYRARIDVCNYVMDDTVTITEKPLPAVIAMNYESSCVDSLMKLWVVRPEKGTNYTLLYKGMDMGLSPLSGETWQDVLWEIPQAQMGGYKVRAERNGCIRVTTDSIQPGEVLPVENLGGIDPTLCVGTEVDLYLENWDNRGTYRLYSRDEDSEEIVGTEEEGRLVFRGVAAGNNYYVSATHLNCTVEEGPFDFPAIALPVLPEGTMSAEGYDCRANGDLGILLKNLNPDYRYTLTGLTTINEIALHTGDTAITKLSFGKHTLVAIDLRTSCVSEPQEIELRIGVPADSISSRLEYCEGSEGVRVELSGQTSGVQYTILDKETGEQVGRNKMSGSRIFPDYVTEGEYILRKERVGLGGGCMSDSSFTVTEYPYPNDEPDIVNPGVICEAGNNFITINNSEQNVHYMLVNKATNKAIDTIYGNGETIAFVDRKPAGEYTIVMRYMGLCENKYYKSFTVTDVPPQAIVSDCEYCHDQHGAEETGCLLQISNMKPTAEYVLYNQADVPQDTLFGVVAGTFEAMTAGDYYVVATYANTSCSDVVGRMSVKRLTQPQIFPVTNATGSGDCGTYVEVALLNGCEGDSVKYYLYFNGFQQKEGPVMAESGIVKFRPQVLPGSYSVYAVKGEEEKCGIWMDGEVVLYAPPANATLSVRGYNCEGAIGGNIERVTVMAQKTERNWRYYISNGTVTSDTLAGMPNTTLSWTKAGGKPLVSGKYYLYGKNACDVAIKMDSVTVRDAMAPAKVALERFKNGVFCDPYEGYEATLNTTQFGVTYTLNTLHISRGKSTVGESWQAGGTGQSLHIANIQTSDTCRATVEAIVDTSGCSYAIDTLMIVADHYAENPGTLSKDLCTTGEGQSITITMSVAKIPSLDYYLIVNGHHVDTVKGSVGEILDRTFKPQTELGCYYIYATSITGECDATYLANCLSLGPESREVEDDWDGNLCIGDEQEITLLDPQPGVTYKLLRNGLIYGSGVEGHEATLVVGKIKEAGTYTVLAAVADCQIYLDWEKEVTVLPRPQLHVRSEYLFPEGTGGVEEILVEAPTTAGEYYQLMKVNAGGGTTTVAAVQSLDGGYLRLRDPRGRLSAGNYYVLTASVNGIFKCSSRQDVVVREVGVAAHQLELVGTPYKCEPSECRSFRLSGSEKDVFYELYRIKGKDTVYVDGITGTGNPVAFRQSQCDTGSYYAIARMSYKDDVTGAEREITKQMGDPIRVYITGQIENFLLTAETDSYCLGSAPSGTIYLPSSQSDAITYRLYRDGNLMPDQNQTGTDGHMIRWSGLAGRTCEFNNDLGYVYTVVATDGNCEVTMSGSVSIVAVNPPKIKTVGNSLTKCTGEQLSIGIQADGCKLNYQWWHNGLKVGENQSGYLVDSMRMEDMGEYVCSVSNSCGRDSMEYPFQVEVRGVITLDKTMEDLMICGKASEEVTLTSFAVGPEIQYAWYRPKAEEDILSTSATLKLYDTDSATHQGAYICRASNSCGAVYDTLILDFDRTPQVMRGDKPVAQRVDTLCIGSSLAWTVSSRDTLYWYHNGVLMPEYKDARTISFDSVTPAHAGRYSVVAKNACSTSEFEVQQLFTDDTLRLLIPIPEVRHYCIGSVITFDIEMSSTERVYYDWYKRGVPIAGQGSMNPAYNAGSGATIRDHDADFVIYYRNKCSSGTINQQIKIDREVLLTTFPEGTESVVKECTESGMALAVLVDQNDRHTPRVNTYQWYRMTTDGLIPAGNSDTLKVEKKVANSGKYYCDIQNTCVASHQSGIVDLRIDTVPILVSLQKPPMTQFCENEEVRYVAKATGGDLRFFWYIQKKGSAPESANIADPGATGGYAFEQSAEYRIEHLPLDMDSCRLWCVIQNQCGQIVTDTILLRVSEEILLTADKGVAYLCANTGGKTTVTISTSNPDVVNWTYSWTDASGKTTTRAVANSASYVETLSAQGTYKATNLYTSQMSCYNESQELEIRVFPRETFTASLEAAGDTVVCLGGSMFLKLHIEGGEAPWRVDIRRSSDRVSAPELGGAPVEVWSRDTVFEISLVDRQTFYIESAEQFMDPEACIGDIGGKPITYTIEQPYNTRFGVVSDTVFGDCRPVDLGAVLQPVPSVGIGRFYINGVLSNDNILSGAAGYYNVVYKASTPAGCTDSVKIRMRLMAGPTATMELSDSYLCNEENTDLIAVFEGSGPFNYTIQMKAYNSKGQAIGRTSSLRGDVLDYVDYPLGYRQDEMADSLRVYTLSSVVDRFGCEIKPNISRELLLRRSPTFIIQGGVGGRYTEEPVYKIAKSAAGTFYFRLTMPTPVPANWSLKRTLTLKNGQVIESNFTKANFSGQVNNIAMSAAMEGVYAFTYTDGFCSARVPEVREVIHLDSGYLQVKAYLQGPFDRSSFTMKSGIWEQGLVPLNKWTKWPELGERKGVDWITVEIRTESANGPKFYAEDFLLLDNGTIVNRNGNPLLAIPNADFTQPYYVVLKHRNHLSIGASELAQVLLSADKTSAPLVDLTRQHNIFFEYGNKERIQQMDYILSLGLDKEGLPAVGMYLGNVLGNSLVSIGNANAGILYEKSELGYWKEDVDFNGRVTLPTILGVWGNTDDVSKMFNNRKKASVIKE